MLSPAARPLRFAGTGGLAGASQLLLLALLMRYGWNALIANSTAFLLAAQLNFVLSLTVTWRDRAASVSLWGRWILFHASIALMAGVNLVTFEVARSFVPVIPASLAGIAAGALGNYMAGDRIVFRTTRAGAPMSNERRHAT